MTTGGDCVRRSVTTGGDCVRRSVTTGETVLGGV